VRSNDQLADILTKPLPEVDFKQLRVIMLGVIPALGPPEFQGV